MTRRSFDQVPTLTTPVCKDMNAEIDRAREQWSRMRDRMTYQQQPAAPNTGVPFFPPEPIEPIGQQRESKSAVDDGLLFVLVAEVIVPLGISRGRRLRSQILPRRRVFRVVCS
jgi:hypothetical protein